MDHVIPINVVEALTKAGLVSRTPFYRFYVATSKVFHKGEIDFEDQSEGDKAFDRTQGRQFLLRVLLPRF